MSEIKGKLRAKDLRTLLVFNNSIKCKPLDFIMPKVTYLGGAAATISICLLITAIGNSMVRKAGLRALVALGLSHLLVRLLKNRVCRLRPKDVLPNINTFDVPLDYYSFPSGHTTAVFAITSTLAVNLPLMGVICLPVALLVAVSRLYLGVHYPSDVLAGVVVAVFSTGVLQLIFAIL